jgi:hypothetical protein
VISTPREKKVISTPREKKVTSTSREKNVTGRKLLPYEKYVIKSVPEKYDTKKVDTNGRTKVDINRMKNT